VGKATIYRWWPSKAAVVMETVLEAANPRIPFPLDVGVAIDALYGAVYYRLLVSHAPLDAAYADTLIHQVFPAFARQRE
jgi:hypothetical protein